MRRVALTGNIASGKSTVAREWERAGAAVVDADVLARRAVEPGTSGLAAVVRRFGSGVLSADGRLDRAALRRIVFADAGARRELERILHPEIHRLREEEDARLEREGARLVVHMIPLLFETGLETEFDDVVFVDSPAGLRLRRLVEQRGLPEAEAQRMIDAQMPAGPKREAATLVLKNEGTIEELERAAADAWRELERRAASAHRTLH
jgi:dephospho-CoA kinase